jgi:predicted dehydrogenase
MRLGMLGSGLIANFYADALHSHRGQDRISVVYSRTQQSADTFARKWNVPTATDDLVAAINHPDVDAVVVGLPNYLHEQAVMAVVDAGKPVLCTKPLGRNADEALRMLNAVEQAGIYNAYLEDLVYTPKTLKALQAVHNGALGNVFWVRSRETHPGPHSDWFWNPEFAGGGAIVDMGCHCIEICRSFIGKDIRPIEVMCWADTQVHPIEVEDHAVGMVKYENGAIGQFEVSWSFRGGMDLRDEVSGTEGTIWLNHWMRTGADMFSAAEQSGYVAEKSETSSGWMFPVADEPGALGYRDMFTDALGCLESGATPTETFYDGYIVNAIMDTAYRSIESKKWEPVELVHWRGKSNAQKISAHRDYDKDHWLIKREKMPDGSQKLILKSKHNGTVTQVVSTS